MLNTLLNSTVSNYNKSTITALVNKIENILDSAVNYAEQNTVENVDKLNFVNNTVTLHSFDNTYNLTRTEILNNEKTVLYTDNVNACLHYVLYCIGFEFADYASNFESNTSLYKMLITTIEQVALNYSEENNALALIIN
jgi:hypothetical protein